MYATMKMRSRSNISRRDFLKTSVAGGLFANIFVLQSCSAKKDFDVLITGGQVYNGTGQPPIAADIGILHGRIVEVGQLQAKTARRHIQAKGKAVAPGFIDIHTHSDVTLLVDGRAPSKIRQGVTTEVVGQDGDSVAPLNAEMQARLRESLQKRYGFDADWQDFDGYFARMRRQGIAVNLISMVGLGTIREHVIGLADRPPTEDELIYMKTLVGKSLQQGARHVSTGLEYTPGSFASTDELTALSAVVGPAGVYATHMRNEDDRVEPAVAEAIRIAEQAGCALNISHLKAQGKRNWHRLPHIFAALAAGRQRGVKITCDRYPYVAYSTGLSNLFPVQAREGGADKFVARLQDPAQRPEIERYVRDKIAALGSWNAVQISSLSGEKYRHLVGRRLGEAAAEAGEKPMQLLFKMLIDQHGGGGMVGFGMSEENTENILANPHTMIASDGSALAVEGPLASGSPHPRNFGTFPRVLGHYVRDRKIMSLQEAIRKMTALPAATLGLADRGTLAPKMWADIVVFDADKIADRATFSRPKQYAEGVECVIVNGELVFEQGAHAAARPGRVL